MEPTAPRAAITTTGGLYQSPGESLKAVRDDYIYWTAKLTDTSLQLSFAIIAANWAVFGSVAGVLASFWSKLSIALVVVGLGISLAAAYWMGELLRARVGYAELNPSRWASEFDAAFGKRDPWPFTSVIDALGWGMRATKTWLPLLAGISFLIALRR
jgi:hypothetical protein